MKLKFLFLSLITTIMFQACDTNQLQQISISDQAYEKVATFKNPAVILVFGQSNIANHGEKIYVYNSQNEVYTFDNSMLNKASSPISNSTLQPLASGFDGTFLPYLGDLLIQNTQYEEVVFINVAVGGTYINDWDPNTKPFYTKVINQEYDIPQGLFYRIVQAKNVLDKLSLNITHVMYHQGESDTVNLTTTQDYYNTFVNILAGLQNLGITAPVYLARASYVLNQTSTNVIQAQNDLINNFEQIKQGPNTDVLTSEYRYDDIHFNAQGLIQHALLWNNELIK